MSHQPLSIDPLERVLFLRTVPAFQELSARHLAVIAQHSTERLFVRGSTLCDATHPVDTAYLVVDGTASVTFRGRRQADAVSGEALGLIELLARVDSGFEAVAATDTRVLELDWRAQLDVCEKHFTVLQAYLEHLSRRILIELATVGFRGSFGGSRSSIAHGRPGNLVDRVLRIASAGGLSMTYPDGLVELARHVSGVSLKEGEYVWKASDESRFFLILEQGRVVHEGLDVHRTTDATGVVGLHTMLARGDRGYSLRAATDIQAMRIDEEPFLDILEDHFEMGLDLMKGLALNLLELRDEG